MLNKKISDPALKAQVAKLKKDIDGENKDKKPKKGTIAYIQWELNNLKKEVVSLRASNTKLIRKVVKTTNIAKTSINTVEKFGTLLDIKTLHKAKKNVHAISVSYRAANIRTLVMREVVGAYSKRKNIKHSDTYKLILLIIHEYDQVDKWWIDRENLTILQWINYFLKISKEENYES